MVGYDKAWRERIGGSSGGSGTRGWGEEHELWKMDTRGLDFGLVGDKIERAMREAITKYVYMRHSTQLFKRKDRG